MSTSIGKRVVAGCERAVRGVLPAVPRPLALGFLGLALHRVWLQCCFYDSYTQSDDGLVTIVGNLSYSAMILIGALCALARRPSASTENRIAWTGAAIMTVSCTMLLIAKVLGNDALLWAGSVLSGVGAAFGGGMWAVAYVRLGSRQAAFFAFGSLALGSLAGFALSFMPVATRLSVAMLMPVCELLCYRGAMAADLGATAGRTDACYDAEPASTLVILFGGLAATGLALGVSRGFPSGDPVPMGVGLRMLHQLGTVAISACIIWWSCRAGHDLSIPLLWGLDLTLMAFGILTASVLPVAKTPVAVAIVNLADTLSLGIIWLMMQDYARHSSLHPFTLVGFAWVARILARDAGRVAILVLGPVSLEVDVAIGLVVLALAVGAALLLSGIVPRGRRLLAGDDLWTRRDGACPPHDVATPPRTQGAADPVALDAPALERWLREARGLSTRETQVVMLIASGRNKVAVAERLSLSENTVRTHAKNAYAKLGVHTKEELVDLLETMNAAR